MNELRPPLQCRVINRGFQYENGKDVGVNHVLTWRGEIYRRADPEKDDLWALEAPDGTKALIETHDIEILGRTPGAHTLRERLENGENIFDEP